MSERKFTNEEILKELVGYRAEKIVLFKNGSSISIGDVLYIIECQQAEIARLRMEYTLLEREKVEDICTFANELKNIKAESYKEIAEIIKQKTLAMVRYDDVLTEDDYCECIDGVVQEMVGDRNEQIH